MIQTGVDITLGDQGASSNARRIAESLSEVTHRAEELNSALDPDKLDKTLQKLDDVMQKQSQSGKRQVQEFEIQSRNVQQTINQVGSSVQQVGKGDVVGGGASLAQAGVGKALMAAGPAGAIVAGAVAAIIGANKLSEVYEGRMGYGMQVAAVMGEYTENIRDNSELIRNAMKDTTHAVAEYGKTFEEGSQAAREFMVAGGKSQDYQRAILDAAHYSTAYGADMMQAARFQGIVGRYGAGNTPLDVVNGLMQSQGYGSWAYDELLSGMETIFTGALSGGVVKNIVDIAQAQEFFGRAGEQYRGALGANFIQNMDQQVAAAANLGKQEDIFLYRAASSLVGGDPIKARLLLEEGFSGARGVELYQAYMGQLGRFTNNDPNTMMSLIHEGLGTNWHQAVALYGLKDRGMELNEEDFKKQLAHNLGRSVESDYLGDVEEIKSLVSAIGSDTFDIKSAIVHGAAKKASEAESEIILSKNEADYRTDQQAENIKKPYKGLDYLDIEQAFYYSEGSREQEDYEKQIEDRLKMLRKSGIYPEEFYEMYGEKIVKGGTAGLTVAELSKMNAYLEKIVNNTEVTANSSIEDIEVVVPTNNWQGPGSYEMGKHRK